MNVKEQTVIPANQLTCEQCRELLSDYVDRELTEAERAAVEDHLGNCPKCGTESARLFGLKKIVQHWDGVKGSGAFHKTLINKMIQESQQMPVLDTTEGQVVGSAVHSPARAEEGEAGKRFPPIWIVLAFACVAVAVYYLVVWLRGL